MKEILFVCTGNTCRSPMAEYIMNSLVDGAGCHSEYVASSAGVSTVDGLEASAGSVGACAAHGIDISSHRSRMLDGQMVADAELILCMGNSHKALIGRYFPAESNAKLYTLGEFANMCDESVCACDISDPYMMGEDVYMAVYRQIKNYLEVIINYLKGKEKNEDCNWK